MQAQRQFVFCQEWLGEGAQFFQRELLALMQGHHRGHGLAPFIIRQTKHATSAMCSCLYSTLSISAG